MIVLSSNSDLKLAQYTCDRFSVVTPKQDGWNAATSCFECFIQADQSNEPEGGRTVAGELEDDRRSMVDLRCSPA